MVTGSLLVRPLRSTGPAPTKIVAPPPAPRTWGSARTGSGDKDISVPDDPSGTLRLDLTTGNGDITAGTTAS
ncbi:hypothetical protein [Streptomyces lydicus]|uniref:hypothetical protein n=1 Tax=Streptomyces lydicus TaxID=47763 RepID=UPI00368D0E54